MEFKHTSVLFDECMEGLNIRPDGVYVDGTLGGGGHSEGICRRLGEQGLQRKGLLTMGAEKFSSRAIILTLKMFWLSWRLNI